jgi:hypothetical protein
MARTGITICSADPAHSNKDNVITLKLTRHEFRDDQKSKRNPRRYAVTVTPLDQQKLVMSGKAYLRCKS